METTELRSGAFWDSEGCCVLSPPGHEGQKEAIRDALNDQEGVVFATSGSCGPPKWVMFKRSSLLASARAVNQHLKVTEDDRFMVALPLYHVGGFGVVARAYDAKCHVSALQGRWNAREFKEAVESDHSTVASLVPTQVHDLVKLGLEAPESLRAVVVGGGKLNEKEGQCARNLGWPVLQSYGMTEAGSQIATATLASLDEPFQAVPLPILPIWEFRTSKAGCLEFRGSALCKYYIEKDREELCCRKAGDKEGWFSSSDLVQITGNQLTVNGRADRKVKILGELVDIESLEKEVREYLDCKRAHLLAVPDSRRGARMLLVVEEDLGEVGGLLAQWNGDRPGFLRIDEVEVVARFPRTGMGKVDVAALRKMLS